MTIGVGILCSTHNFIDDGARPRPDAIILLADTMGSTETDSTGELHKINYDEKNELFAVSANNMSCAGELFQVIADSVSQIPPAEKSHGSLWKSISFAVNGYRSEKFKWDVMAPRYSYAPNLVPVSEHENLMREWREYNIGVDMLIASFASNGMALLYYIGPTEGSSGLVHLWQFPGWCAIGAGSSNAAMWLNYRAQHLGRNIRQSAVHAFEAGRMAASAPSVNERAELLIAVKGQCYEISSRRTSDGSPISLEELQVLAKRFAPRKTDSIGFQQSSK
jgi:hypothetical protein